MLSPPKPTRGQQAAVAEAAKVAAIIGQADEAARAAAQRGHAEAEPAGNRDMQQPATQPQTQPAAQPATQPASEKKAPPRSAAKPRGTPRGGRGVAAAAAGASQLGASSQATGPASQAPPASQGGGGTAQKRVAVGLHAPSSQVAVLLPDKLPQLKMLVELETNPGGRQSTAQGAWLSGQWLRAECGCLQCQHGCCAELALGKVGAGRGRAGAFKRQPLRATVQMAHQGGDFPSGHYCHVEEVSCS